MTKKSVKRTFENDITRLEEISILLERDDIGLEDAIKLFEEGITLSKTCISTLKNAELRVTELRKKIDDIPSADNDLFDE